MILMSVGKLFKNLPWLQNIQQMGMLESTVVFYVTTDANDLEQFRPDSGLKDSNDQGQFYSRWRMG